MKNERSERWNTKWIRLENALDQGENITVAGLGDSLTYGWMVSQGYFARFVSELGERWPAASIAAINAGIPGDTAAGGLRRLDRVLAQSPHLVLIQFGLNDLFSGVEVTAFESSYRQIADRIMQSAAIPVLVVSSPLPNPSQQKNAGRYYDAIRSLGQELGIPVADTDRHMGDAMKTGIDPLQLYLDDGSHPSDEGHRLMAQAVGALFS